MIRNSPGFMILFVGSVAVTPLRAADLVGTVKSIDKQARSVVVTQDGTGKDVSVTSDANTVIKTSDQIEIAKIAIRTFPV
jgi:hypothetical protein